MILNYLKTAVRNLIRHRFFSAINIIGLAVAMSICMSIIMLVADQMSYDRFNSKRDRIFRINTQHVDDNGVAIGSNVNAASTMRLKRELLDRYTGIERVVRIKRGFGNSWQELENQNVNIPLSGYFADPEVFEVFEYEFQYGDPATALRDPYSVVLTRKAANKLFSQENPLGQGFKVGSGWYTVTGVLKDNDKKSHIVFEGLASMATLKSMGREQELENWFDYWNGWTYVVLEPGTTTGEMQAILDQVYTENIATAQPGVPKATFSLQSILEITPGQLMSNAIGPELPWVFVYFLGGLSLVILLTSCFNFTNLSIARSLTRAREIGVRKVTGAARWQIFIQFLTESVTAALAALVVAGILTVFLKPAILQLKYAALFRWDLQANYTVYVVFIALAVITGIVAGLFPALVLSGLKPVAVLKNLANVKLISRMRLRKILLVSQLTLSLFFILTVIIMYNQLNLFVSKDHGFNMAENIRINLNGTSAARLKGELLKYSNVVAVSAVSHVPAAGMSNSLLLKRSPDEKDAVSFGHFVVDEDYLNNMELGLIAGKFFVPGQNNVNKDYVVINQSGVEKLHYDTPIDAIGQEVIVDYDSSRRTIIGVVADYNHRDLTRGIGPVALMFDSAQANVLQVRFSGTYDLAAGTVEKAWGAANPGLKIDFKSVESEINQFYEIVFGDLVKILGVISFLAILISCLGLLGMATYMTETRKKEISIRKVLGSGNIELVLLLSRGFLILLALAICVGVPLTYLVNNLWLQEIAYHTTMSLSVVMLGILLLIVFGIITIGSQTIRALFVNPVENLKGD